MRKGNKQLALILAWAFVVPAFVLAQFSFWQNKVVLAQSVPVSTPAVDQGAIDDTKSSISSLQKKLAKEQKEKAALQQDLVKIQGSVTATQKDINKTQGLIKETEANISRKELEIQDMEAKIIAQNTYLATILQELYYAKKNTGINVVLADGDFADLLSDSDSLVVLEERVHMALQNIIDSKEQVDNEKAQLADTKDSHEKLLVVKSQQKQALVADQVDTQQSIESQDKIIARLSKELSQLQSDLASLTGRSYNAKDIKEAVSFASDKTDVPMGFLIGVLKMETNLGANVGGCTYGEVEKGAEASYRAKKLGKTAWATFQNRRDIFQGICKDLNYDYARQKVSCNPKGYVGTGGAMGVAQFMPDTWQAYENQVAALTGHKTPDPWNLTDGVVAMASKLRKTPGVTDGKKSALKSAACSYLGTCYAPYINGILYWADNYKDLLK